MSLGQMSMRSGGRGRARDDSRVAIITKLGLLASWAGTYHKEMWGDFQPTLPPWEFQGAIAASVASAVAFTVFGPGKPTADGAVSALL